MTRKGRFAPFVKRSLGDSKGRYTVWMETDSERDSYLCLAGVHVCMSEWLFPMHLQVDAIATGARPGRSMISHLWKRRTDHVHDIACTIAFYLKLHYVDMRVHASLALTPSSLAATKLHRQVIHIQTTSCKRTKPLFTNFCACDSK